MLKEPMDYIVPLEMAIKGEKLCAPEGHLRGLNSLYHWCGADLATKIDPAYGKQGKATDIKVVGPRRAACRPVALVLALIHAAGHVVWRPRASTAPSARTT
jgi:hypothetical protein